MCVGSTVTGMFSPRGGTRRYSSVCSAVIRSSVARAGGGPLFAAALYHPFIRRHASLAFGRSSFSKVSTAVPASYTRRLLSTFRLAQMALPSLRIPVCARGFRLIVTRASTSRQVSSEIHAFRCCSRGCGFGTACRRSLKSLSSRVSRFGGYIGILLCPAMYLSCSRPVPPLSSPITM